MANLIYDKFKEECLTGANNLSTDNIKAVLVDSADYTVSASDEDLADIAAAARVATSANLSSKTVTGGVFDAADVTIAGVTGDSIEAVVLYVDTGTESTSRLIAYLDTGFTGLPITPNSGDIIIQWNASGIFKL